MTAKSSELHLFDTAIGAGAELIIVGSGVGYFQVVFTLPNKRRNSLY